MRTQRILSLLNGIVAWPVLLIAFVTQFVLGLLLLIPIVDALFLLLVSIIFGVAFFGPLLALSWLWLRVPFLRLPLAILGIPWALVGNKFSVLIPVAPAELDGRISKMLFTVLWPYSFLYVRWDGGSLKLDDQTGDSSEGEFIEVLLREVRHVPPQREYVGRRRVEMNPGILDEVEVDLQE